MDPVLLVLAGISAFVMYRLFSVMGTRTGHEQQHDPDASGRAPGHRNAGRQEPAPDVRSVPVAASPAAEPLQKADPDFDEAAFLAGARAAYEMIVTAYADGDIDAVRDHVSASVYNTFKASADSRKSRQHKAEIKFIGIDSAIVADSSVRGDDMHAVVTFASNQVRVTTDASGNVIEGDPNRIDLVRDRWTFSRNRYSPDPNWVLAGTGTVH